MARVVMIGSGFEVRGGVSAMAAVCARHGLFERWGAEYLATHCDGSALRKLSCAARAWLAFGWRLARRRVALLHVHLNSDASFWRKALFVVPALAAGVPYVLHVHCGGFAAFHRERCGALGRALVTALLRRARAVVALSEAAATELAAIAPGIVPRVIPNPVEVPHPAARPGQAAPVVAYLGALTEAKGVHDLLRAWPAVVAAIPGARLVLGGQGDVAAIHARCAELGIAASVETPGWLGAAEKEALLRRSAVFVLPSHREAMPMSLLEAMAAGVPVVGTRVGAVPSMVEEGVSGLTVPVGDGAALAGALVGLLGDGERRARMGEAARGQVAARFSAAAVVPRIEALWAGLGVGPSDAQRQTGREIPRLLGQTDYAQGAGTVTGGQVRPPSLP